jgi:hypothetical protein
MSELNWEGFSESKGGRDFLIANISETHADTEL